LLLKWDCLLLALLIGILFGLPTFQVGPIRTGGTKLAVFRAAKTVELKTN
jgi:hypothetical protein